MVAHNAVSAQGDGPVQGLGWVGGYLLRTEIGRGGTGTVWSAEDGGGHFAHGVCATLQNLGGQNRHGLSGAMAYAVGGRPAAPRQRKRGRHRLFTRV